jgi:hypothetical protein
MESRQSLNKRLGEILENVDVAAEALDRQRASVPATNVRDITYASIRGNNDLVHCKDQLRAYMNYINCLKKLTDLEQKRRDITFRLESYERSVETVIRKEREARQLDLLNRSKRGPNYGKRSGSHANDDASVTSSGSKRSNTEDASRGGADCDSEMFGNLFAAGTSSDSARK